MRQGWSYADNLMKPPFSRGNALSKTHLTEKEGDSSAAVVVKLVYINCSVQICEAVSRAIRVTIVNLNEILSRKK